MGGPEFTASKTQDFLQRWGDRHRQSSAYHPQYNGYVEVMRNQRNISYELISALQEAWIMISYYGSNSRSGIHLSLAQIIFGHPIRYALALSCQAFGEIL
ncbi:endogenous retrovirus group k member 113 pol protein-like [Plakobranchus ocellatus]|uniref:Endogenous retrovirus group k member 113 pol protein-like n=1 Tax=Plakobranchus ocellatus TaxID=259542 RepID=A0AAV4C800_9GAST|nr:endogenous retrovirus group k member 113 pol protein-like [Plakobranchus ocellatus]